MDELSNITAYSNFILVACVIDKEKLKLTDNKEHNTYHLALNYCLDGLYDFLEEKNQLDRKTHVLVECRGRKEDKELELAFRRMCDGNNPKKVDLPFDVVFVDKKANSTGLQLADLVARPIGINYLRPHQTNRAFDILKTKFLCRGGRACLGEAYEDYGLKIVPPKKTNP